jgi:acyl dehydratase
MPINSSAVGTSAEPVVHDIDARWTMAYAASLGDTLACYFDTTRSQGIISHPMFPCCFEWPAFLAMRARLVGAGLTDAEMLRGVHATADTMLQRPIRPGDRLTTRASIAEVRRTKPGAYVITRMETRDANADLVCTTHYGSIFRATDVIGPDRAIASTGAWPLTADADSLPAASIPIPVCAGLAHVYTECARIWNPIHTDAAVAAAAGLPAIILHGTATLALAVSKIVETEAGGRAHLVTRVAARFAAMVLMPSTLTLRILARDQAPARRTIRFDVQTQNGETALRNALVAL